MQYVVQRRDPNEEVFMPKSAAAALPVQAGTRRRQGVSQYKQPHVMLSRGLQVLENLFPGYQQGLSKAGALDVDWLDDVVVVSMLS